MQWLRQHLTSLYSWLLAGLVFIIPSNLFYKLDESFSYINGLQVDYLIPKFYVSDVFILSILLLSLVVQPWPRLRRLNKLTLFGLTGILLTVVIVTRQFLTPGPQASLFFLMKLIFIAMFGWWLTHHKKLLNSSGITGALVLTIVFQSLLGIYQFYGQSSLGGYFLFGEPNLANQIGIATGTWNGAELLLPYGTTAHPNVLAGTLAVYWLLLALTQKKRNQFLQIVIILTGFLSIWLILLTQSWSAALTLILGGLLILTRQPRLIMALGGLSFVFSPVVLWLINQGNDSPTIARRVILNEAGIKMWQRFPLVGSGFNMFTTWLEIVSRNREVVRFVQPAHHIGILWLAETGLAGVGFVVWLTAWLKQKVSNENWLLFLTKVAVLLPIASLDHYLLTLQTGWLLVLLWLIWPFKLPNHTQHLWIAATQLKRLLPN